MAMLRRTGNMGKKQSMHVWKHETKEPDMFGMACRQEIWTCSANPGKIQPKNDENMVSQALAPDLFLSLTSVKANEFACVEPSPDSFSPHKKKFL